MAGHHSCAGETCSRPSCCRPVSKTNLFHCVVRNGFGTAGVETDRTSTVYRERWLTFFPCFNQYTNKINKSHTLLPRARLSLINNNIIIITMYPYGSSSSDSNNKNNSRRSFHDEMRQSRDLYDDGKEQYARGEFAAALDLFRRAVAKHEVLFGKYHKETVQSYWWMGKAACKLEQRKEALKAFQRSARMGESALSQPVYQEMCQDIQNCWNDVYQEEDSTKILSSLLQIFRHEQEGDKAFKGRHYSKAIQCYCQALTLQDTLIGKDTLDGADIRCKLAFSLLKTSATPEAAKTLKLAYKCYVDTVGEDHPATYGVAATMKTITA
eukprot:scaffold1106_cov126-Cylindrotheca_fusiformis.AAC.7